jgi:D-tyrosyl-tRNA(Tyr) deacylase
VGQGDSLEEAQFLAEKVVQLRIFSDAEGKFNLSVLDIGGGVLVVSQFTLFADTRRGRRPSFISAASPDVAAPLVERFMDAVRGSSVTVAGGRFGAHMQVDLVNEGPVTIILDTDDWKRSRGSSSSGMPPNP